MKKYYTFAGIGVQIDISDEWMYENEQHLAPFRVSHVEEPYVFRFEKVPALLPPVSECIANTGAMRVYANGVRYIGSVDQAWENAYGQVLPNGRNYQVLLKQDQFSGRVGVHTVLNMLCAEHLIAQAGGFVFHSSFIGVNGSAILFTAPSETGKSTQADLWQRLRGAAIHNGDRSAVRWQDGKAYACGIPFAGSSTYCQNITLPLEAIVYLRQAPQTTIRRLRGAEAFRRIWEGVSVNTWDREDMAQVSDTVAKVLSQVPMFELSCTPDESAVIALEGALGI